MGQAKKRNKSHRPRWNGDGAKVKTQPWKLARVFNPLIGILDQLERDGTIDETTAGQAVLRAVGDSYWYDSHAAITGMIETYEIHETRTGRTLAMDPLRQLATQLRDGGAFSEADIQAARACLNRMRVETAEMTLVYAVDLIQTFQIKEELQEEAA